MDEIEEKQQLRFACLEMACRQTKPNQEGMVVDLNSSEAVAMAEEFYKFVTRKELN